MKQWCEIQIIIDNAAWERWQFSLPCVPCDNNALKYISSSLLDFPPFHFVNDPSIGRLSFCYIPIVLYNSKWSISPWCLSEEILSQSFTRVLNIEWCNDTAFKSHFHLHDTCMKYWWPKCRIKVIRVAMLWSLYDKRERRISFVSTDHQVLLYSRVQNMGDGIKNGGLNQWVMQLARKVQLFSLYYHYGTTARDTLYQSRLPCLWSWLYFWRSHCCCGWRRCIESFRCQEQDSMLSYFTLVLVS